MGPAPSVPAGRAVSALHEVHWGPAEQETGEVWYVCACVTPGSARPAPGGDPTTPDLACGLTCPRSRFLFCKMGLCLSAELLGVSDGNTCPVFSRAPTRIKPPKMAAAARMVLVIAHSPTQSSTHPFIYKPHPRAPLCQTLFSALTACLHRAAGDRRRVRWTDGWWREETVQVDG